MIVDTYHAVVTDRTIRAVGQSAIMNAAAVLEHSSGACFVDSGRCYSTRNHASFTTEISVSFESGCWTGRPKPRESWHWKLGPIIFAKVGKAAELRIWPLSLVVMGRNCWCLIVHRQARTRGPKAVVTFYGRHFAVSEAP